jgi:hypothetical protein
VAGLAPQAYTPKSFKKTGSSNSTSRNSYVDAVPTSAPHSTGGEGVSWSLGARGEKRERGVKIPEIVRVVRLWPVIAAAWAAGAEQQQRKRIAESRITASLLCMAVAV